MKNLYKITIIVLVLIMSNAAFGQDIMYLDKDPANAGVVAITAYLYGEGYNITFVESAVFKEGDTYKDPAAYADFDAILIGEDLGSGDVFNFHVAGYPIPCVTTEGWAFKNAATKWSWLSDEANQFHQLGGGDSPTVEDANTLVFLDEEETWLGQQYDTDEEFLWCNNTDAAVGSNGIDFEDVLDAIPFVKLPAAVMDGKPIGWIFPAGTDVTTDPNAANGGPFNITLEHPMVYLGLIAAGQNEGTEDFHALIHNCIRYVTGDYEEPGAVRNINTVDANVYPNPTNDIVNISLTSSLSGTVAVNIYDISGKLAESVNYSTSGVKTLSIDISDLASGLYIFEINTENEVFTGKINKN